MLPDEVEKYLGEWDVRFDFTLTREHSFDESRSEITDFHTFISSHFRFAQLKVLPMVLYAVTEQLKNCHYYGGDESSFYYFASLYLAPDRYIAEIFDGGFFMDYKMLKLI